MVQNIRHYICNLLYGTIAASIMGSRRCVMLFSGPHAAFHVFSFPRAFSKASRHSGGSSSSISLDTAPRPWNSARKAGTSRFSYTAADMPVDGVSIYMSMTVKFRGIRESRGVKQELSPEPAGLDESVTCSIRAWVGCMMAGYCIELVWTS